VLEGGRVYVKDSPSTGFALGELAKKANPLRGAVKPGTEPGLEATAYFGPSRGSTASGVHAMIVEVDKETANVEIKRYVVVHDCGVQLNPMIVEGQIQGGVAHGIGNAFYEQLIFDEGGQLLNASLMDYLLPTALDVPRVELGHLETPSPLNPTGAKGVGEAGAIPTGALFAQAVEDALHGTGVEILEIPLSPNRLFELIRDGARDGAKGAFVDSVPLRRQRALELSGSFDFGAPVEKVYEALLDPTILGSVMPGSQRLELVARDRYRGVMKVGLGPVSAAEFTLSVAVHEPVPNEGFGMAVDATGKLGFVTGWAKVRLAPGADGGTTMRYEAHLHVGGTIAAVGQRLLDSAGRVMSSQGLKALDWQLKRRFEGNNS
jgi:carbon monoxide dehydrogenase subunit G